MLSNALIIIIAVLCLAGFILFKRKLFQTLSISFFGIITAVQVLLLKIRIWQSEHLYNIGDINIEMMTPEQKHEALAKIAGNWQLQQIYYEKIEFIAYALIIFFILIPIIQSLRKS